MKARIGPRTAVMVLASTILATAGCGAGAGERVEASGTVEVTEADLGFQAPGRVEEVRVREGDPVRRGDTLAVLERTELEATLTAARAQETVVRARLQEMEAGSRPQELAQARAAVRAAAEAEAQARRETERARRLHDGGALSRQALEQAETRLEAAVAATTQARETLALVEEGPRRETLAAQRALVEQAAAAVARTAAVLDQTVIVAPRDGLVTVRHREPGEIVSPGAPVLTLMDPDDRWVRIYVREDRLGRVRLGSAAEIRIDSWPDRVFAGEVVFVGSEAEFTPRNVQTTEERTQLVYPVKVRILDDAELRVKPGLPADVVLEEEPEASTGGTPGGATATLLRSPSPFPFPFPSSSSFRAPDATGAADA
ncbi:MAG: efflux RND transporter periplasmic adaptor subunit [Gemmatimonadales bacterium]|nr:MAG: efflux RND transporter periplasmic adaptor subunit [Gemmatimonadales bacterium]